MSTRVLEPKRSNSLRALLTAYDNDAVRTLRELAEAETGTERVQVLHRLRHLIAVHDSMLASVLCPLLDQLPDGSPVADRLRQGCSERAELLARFQGLTDGVSTRNVYPVSGEEIESIIEGIGRSFEAHTFDETTEVSRLLQASSTSNDPDVLAAIMGLAVDEAPSRIHSAGEAGRPVSRMLKGLERFVDQMHDWSDTHHGWPR